MLHIYLCWVIEQGKLNKNTANFWKYERNYFKVFMEKQKIWQTQNDSEKNINEQVILIWSSSIKLQNSRECGIDRWTDEYIFRKHCRNILVTDPHKYNLLILTNEQRLKNGGKIHSYFNKCCCYIWIVT